MGDKTYEHIDPEEANNGSGQLRKIFLKPTNSSKMVQNHKLYVTYVNII